MWEIGLQVGVFGLALWLGVYLVGRNPLDRRLLLAGLGLVAYGVGLALDFLAGQSLDVQVASQLLVWERPFFFLPILIWLLLFWLLLRGETSWRERWRNQPRPAITLLAATIFFALGVGLLLVPVLPVPRIWLILGIGGDLLALGVVIAIFDAFDEGETLRPHFLRSFLYALMISLLFGGQILLAMQMGVGERFPMLLLLLTTITAAILMQALIEPVQGLLDRLALRPYPHIAETRAAFRSAAAALVRTPDALDPETMDEVQFARLTRRALSHMGNLPRLAASPLIRLPQVSERLARRGAPDTTLERAAELRAVLTESIERLKPRSDADFGTSDEWRFYNALYFPYVAGLKPFSRRRQNSGEGKTAVQQAHDWFLTTVPPRTLYNWQTAAARLVAHDLREQAKAIRQHTIRSQSPHV